MWEYLLYSYFKEFYFFFKSSINELFLQTFLSLQIKDKYISQGKCGNSLAFICFIYNIYMSIYIFPYQLPLSTLPSLILAHLSRKLQNCEHNLDIFWPLRPFDMTELGIVSPEKNSWEFYLRHPKMCRKERRTNEFVV